MTYGYRTDERRTLILWALHRHLIGPSVRDLAGRFRVSTSVITHDLEALERQGYARQRGRPGTPYRWAITPAGERALHTYQTIPTARIEWPRRAPPQEEAAAA